MLFTDTLVRDHVTPNIHVMDILGQGLDKVGRGQVSGWKKCYKHLAEYFEVPEEVLLKIQTSSTNHPSERLFYYLLTVKPDITIGAIKDSLGTLGRKDIVEILKDCSHGECMRQMTVILVIMK